MKINKSKRNKAYKKVTINFKKIKHKILNKQIKENYLLIIINK